ncbi:unnamed protein product (macronuclear) [Paramecium tetraurelia]|uniref:Trichohyalin-plectin-homology domain-containing protein n=1 Tax=Paramecium tetraurelia TaxID=5888 RepID=A0DZ38_PARTE|nr:uncharacterized protein GSPATT00003274001 [Paramecium tetraurelia]CAK88305.1 unnamed protein product [Paramecium tetraurelia]|eukprot:XP_001455702.1 hypothetical protein (macronuclear) [Paramecium tetraurelia strain d4-2]
MQDIRQMRQKYESIKQSNPNTPKKCLTPTISAQYVKTSPGLQMTPPSNPRLKKICNNCLNRSLMKQKEFSVQQQRQEDQKLYQQVKQSIDQENQYRDQLAEEKRRKFFTYHKINGELIQLHQQRVKTEQQNEQVEVANFFKKLEKDDNLRKIKQLEKKEQMQQYYLRDLKNQIQFKEEEKSQQKLQNNKSDIIESQFWTQMENEQIHNQQIKAQQQRQMINYWKYTLGEKQKLKQQQEEMNKIEQEQLKYIQKSNEKMMKASEQAKKQQMEQFKQEIQYQVKINEQKRRDEENKKQQEYYIMIQQKQQEEQREKQKQLDKSIERLTFIKDIEQQINFKKEEKERELSENEKKLLIQENPISLVCCDECKHNCPSKVITNILQ